MPHVHPTRIVDSPTAAAAPDGGKSSTEELPPLCGGKNSLEFVEVELDSPQPCWDAALDGAHACLHFASPIFGGRGSDLVGSCIQGAEKIVRACRNSGPEFALLVVCGSVQACNSGEDAEAGRQTEFTEVFTVWFGRGGDAGRASGGGGRVGGGRWSCFLCRLVVVVWGDHVRAVSL